MCQILQELGAACKHMFSHIHVFSWLVLLCAAARPAIWLDVILQSDGVCCLFILHVSVVTWDFREHLHVAISEMQPHFAGVQALRAVLLQCLAFCRVCRTLSDHLESSFGFGTSVSHYSHPSSGALFVFW